jgi:esterase/lipase superfamily enzyme
MYQQLGALGKDASIQEGYASLSVCLSEKDVEVVLQAWRAYPHDTDTWEAGLELLRAPPSWAREMAKQQQ